MLRSLRAPIVGLVAAGMIIVGPTAASAADPPSSGDPLAATPLLRSGFGVVERPDDATVANGKVGAPAGCGSAEGAAAYRIPLTEAAMLRVTITEIDAGGVCAVGLYRLRRGGAELGSLYENLDERSFFAHREITCGTSCQITQRLGVNAHFLVVWPAGSGAVSQRFSMTGTLRGFVTMTGGLSGLEVGACRRIDTGTTSTLRYAVNPAADVAGTDVEVRRRHRPTGATATVGSFPLDADGAGAFEVPSGPRGYHDVRLRFPGNALREPAVLSRCLISRGSTKMAIEPRRFRFQWDDYSVWRDGDTAVIRVTVGPGTLARGVISMRIERNIGNHQYKPWTVREGVPVKNGLAVFKMRATHRPDGLPFYRIRGEWPGSNTHRPGKSPWMCIQFNR